jgi:hypothetical protein
MSARAVFQLPGSNAVGNRVKLTELVKGLYQARPRAGTSHVNPDVGRYAAGQQKLGAKGASALLYTQRHKATKHINGAQCITAID